MKTNGTCRALAALTFVMGSGPALAAAQAPQNFVVSAARLYDASGPVKYASMLSNVETMTLPTPTNAAADGRIAFRGARDPNYAGKLGVTVFGIRAELDVACEVGGTLTFNVRTFDDGGVPRIITAVPENGRYLVRFRTKPMAALGDASFSLESTTNGQNWSFMRCDVALVAPVVPKPPDGFVIQ